MENYFDKQFELGYFEMNKFGEASPTTILTLLEETAAEHCHSIHHSLYDLEKQNIGWVLLSGIMQMKRYPGYKEKISIRTWLSQYSTVKGYRENIIYDEKGNLIGSAKGLWVFFDIKRRRPAPIFDAIKKQWSFDPEVSVQHDITQKLEAIDAAAEHKDFTVSRFDVDMYQHLNNIRYLQWLMESIPEDIFEHYYLHTIDGRFMAEAQYGDAVLAFTEKDGMDPAFIHTIRTQKDLKVCATAKTIWKERQKQQ